MVKINVLELLSLASEFEDSAKTLRSGDLPNFPSDASDIEKLEIAEKLDGADRLRQKRKPLAIDVEEAGPVSFDTYLNLTAENLKEVKNYIDKALRLIVSTDSFSPDVELFFYQANLKLEKAKEAYKQASDV